jgi:hypothetical protein
MRGFHHKRSFFSKSERFFFKERKRKKWVEKGGGKADNDHNHNHSLEIWQIFGRAEILQVLDVCEELVGVEDLLEGEVLKVERVGEHLDELDGYG